MTQKKLLALCDNLRAGLLTTITLISTVSKCYAIEYVKLKVSSFYSE